MRLWIMGVMADSLLPPLPLRVGLVKDNTEMTEKLRWVEEQIATLVQSQQQMQYTMM
jgi:hypothetical protein